MDCQVVDHVFFLCHVLATFQTSVMHNITLQCGNSVSRVAIGSFVILLILSVLLFSLRKIKD